MNITLKLRLPPGVKKIDANENIAKEVLKKLSLRKRNGKIGEEHPVNKDMIQGWIFEESKRRKYLSDADLTRLDYWGFIERLYKRIMCNYIRRDEIKQDDDDTPYTNPYYFDGLVYLNGKGYIIVNTNDLIDAYATQRQDSLDGQKDHLEQKCKDALNFVKLLKSGEQSKLGDAREVA